jgi:hypothetical protein
VDAWETAPKALCNNSTMISSMIRLETRREILEGFGIIGKLAMENGQKVLYLNWAIYETRIPLDRLDFAGNKTHTYSLAVPQDGMRRLC